MDRFDAMQAFARVVETGSFTKAAETLHLSRATVSHLVQQLEARLRVTLLNRTTRKVDVTADGAAYYARVVRLLADLEDAETQLPGASALPRGRLRVDVPSPFARLLLVPSLPAFHARYPDIQLDLGVSDRMVDVIGDLPLGVYASPVYLARMGAPAHPSDLEDTAHRTVGFLWARTGKPLAYAMQRGEEEVHVQGHYVVAMDDGNAYLAAGVAGLGVLWLPEYMAHAPLADGTLVRLFDDWHMAPMPMHVAWPPSRHVSARLRVFIDWIVELMATHAPVTARPPPGPR